MKERTVRIINVVALVLSLAALGLSIYSYVRIQATKAMMEHSD